MSAKIAKSMITAELKHKALDDFVANQNDLPFDTMIISNGKPCKERWTPKSINDFSRRLNISCDKPVYKKIKENVSYNLQYFEHLISSQLNKVQYI